MGGERELNYKVGKFSHSSHSEGVTGKLSKQDAYL